MVDTILLILRYSFLVMFYVFLFKLTMLIVDDLRGLALRDKGDRLPAIGAQLLVTGSTDQGLPVGTTIPLSTVTVLGRADNCDVKILDDFISSKHARIVYQDDCYWLEDLHSLNGTYLNGAKISEPTAIADGDTIRVGGVSFLVCEVDL